MEKYKIGILYVTFARDLQWIDYSLQSVRKYATGFSAITIVVPTHDVDKFLYLEKKFSTPDCPVLIKNFLEYPGKGFVHHLAMKCYADVFMPDMDLILHLDPDCLFNKPVAPYDYVVKKSYLSSELGYQLSIAPVLVVEPYEAIKKSGHMPRYGWKSITEEALKFECPVETMCRHPAIHWRSTYIGLRAYIEMIHITPFTDFVIKQKNSFPQGFGEFNTLGSYAYRFLKESYHFIDRGFDGEKNDPEPKLHQMWSYTGVDNNIETIKQILK